MLRQQQQQLFQDNKPPSKNPEIKKINGEQLSQKPFQNENHQQTIDFLTSVPLIVTLVE